MTIRGLEPGRRAALLTVECQNGPTNPAYSDHQGLAGQAEARGIIERIADVADACRAHGVPIFHNKLVHRSDWLGSGVNSPLLGSNRKQRKMLVGSPEVEMHPRLRVQPTDFQIDRLTGVTAFHGTTLDQLLRNCGVETVIITGVSTNLGIPGCGTEAVNHGYNVVFPEDCTAGVWPEAHEFQVANTLPILGVVTTAADVIAALEAIDT
ncbi:MAG: cysteine hydrolase [Ilumatobacteraceae bacterium]